MDETREEEKAGSDRGLSFGCLVLVAVGGGLWLTFGSTPILLRIAPYFYLVWGAIMLSATLGHRLTRPRWFWVEPIDPRTDPVRYWMFLLTGAAAVGGGIYWLAARV